MEGMPRQDRATSNAVEFSIREGALQASLEELDKQIAPLRAEFRSGNKSVEAQLTELMDKRGELVRDAAAKGHSIN